ncbi:MAG: hypothetical protein QXX38_02405 [Candidatus Aenigmatarchaeota archaeon]
MKSKKMRKMKISKRIKNIKDRVIEIFSPPTIILTGVIFRVFFSFVSWIKAILLTWGVIDGFSSNYLYKEEKFFPFQFLRYCRIVANFSGILNPTIPILWNIGDGIYSLFLYKTAKPIENLPRYGRILNGTLLIVFS